jgi:hypothetical protein
MEPPNNLITLKEAVAQIFELQALVRTLKGTASPQATAQAMASFSHLMCAAKPSPAKSAGYAGVILKPAAPKPIAAKAKPAPAKPSPAKPAAPTKALFGWARVAASFASK